MQGIKLGAVWLLGCLAICFVAYGAEQSYLVDNPPHTYIVRSGDTLWDISEKFLKDPWRWKEIWRSSPNIKDPDLIYPGDVITLSEAGGKPYLTVQRANTSHRQVVLPNGTVKLSPSIRSEAAKKPIPTLPIDVIGPFLTASQVVTQGAFNSAPTVAALDEDHLLGGEGHKLYVKGLPLNDIKGFTIFREGKVYTHPKTKEVLGLEAQVLGNAQLLQRGPLATFEVTRSIEEVRIGDKLMPLNDSELGAYFTPKQPKRPSKGYILSVFGGLSQIGRYQVVTVTGGRDLDREPGDVLLVYQTQQDLQHRLQKIEIPPDYVGQLIIFRVFDKVSFGLVMKAFRTIYLLDEVTSP